ncbi:c-type cytochrome [Pseudorhodobacter sp. W20_MBD10_FR17]|uniref:c-type cytochrome n=1 Tax=Pseudorhodobacter sp. W20_MBD10_FR17 TaxID=3240266 RepID=UPI003F98067B
MKRFLLTGSALALIGLGGFLVITRPAHVDATAVAALTGDAMAGEKLFWLGGCASCHAAENAEGDALKLLSGGKSFVTDFGTFHAPNISNDPDHGIGAWTNAQFADALLHGTSPENQHFYPAFPYASYTRATLQEAVDLRAYMATLPSSAEPNKPHDVGFPFNQRWLLGGWKLLFLSDKPVVIGDLTDQENQGRHLVEGLGHCGECHTPRNALGGLDKSAWLSGAANPDGKGRIPNITPAKLDWSETDIAEYLNSGFTPEYDSAGGSMAEVVVNLSHLSDEERAAIAAYLKRVPPISN